MAQNQLLTAQLQGMERLMRHPSLRGIPDLVLEGDGYTLEFIGPTLLCVDIRKLNHLKPSSRQECSKSRP